VRIRPTKGTSRVVALINPPTITARASLSYYGSVPPLGLAYVAAAARAEGHRVQVIDAAGEALESVLIRHSGVGALAVQGLSIPQIVGRLDPATEVVGIGHMFLHQWPLLRELMVGEPVEINKAEIRSGPSGMAEPLRNTRWRVALALISATGGRDPGSSARTSCY